MPLDLEAKQDDSIQLAEELEQEQSTAQANGWLISETGSSFLKKFTMAMDLANQSGMDMPRATFEALMADYQELSPTERYAVSSALNGTFPEFSWFDKNEYDTFCNPPFTGA
jgi:hypothetical protein